MTGNFVPISHGDYAAAVAAALRHELQDSRSSVKTLMRWTGAGERTVKNWLAEVRGPSAEHLILLMKRSDAVLKVVLHLSGRDAFLADGIAAEMEAALVDAIHRLLEVVQPARH